MAENKTLVIERIFNAPIEKVWDAFTNPERIKKWFGPRDYTAPDAVIDLRVGGTSLISMMGKDGKKIWGTGTYKEIVPLKKIVVTDSFADEKGNVVSGEVYGMKGMPLELLITYTFEDLGGKTKFTLKHEGLPVGENVDGANTGWSESFDKLTELLRG